MNDAQIDGLDGRIDKLTVEVRAGFDQTQAAFDDHRLYAEFLAQGVRADLNSHRAETAAGFSRLERRLDGVDERFDRLEQLIRERP